MEFDHRGKVALITGSGAKRIGNVVALALAKRGFNIALHYHRSEEQALATVDELQALGVLSAAFCCDLRQESEIDELVAAVYRRFSRLDVLVTAQGAWQPKPLEEVTAQDLIAQFSLDAAATFLCAKKCGLLMTEQQDGGSIITIADWALARPYREYSAYFAAKGSIPTITRSLAVELASRNPMVRVNCILPGPVMVPESEMDSHGYYIREKTLLKRLGTPEHIAHAVMFLAENDFVTGICLPVDGGRTIAD